MAIPGQASSHAPSGALVWTDGGGTAIAQESGDLGIPQDFDPDTLEPLPNSDVSTDSVDLIDPDASRLGIPQDLDPATLEPLPNGNQPARTRDPNPSRLGIPQDLDPETLEPLPNGNQPNAIEDSDSAPSRLGVPQDFDRFTPVPDPSNTNVPTSRDSDRLGVPQDFAPSTLEAFPSRDLPFQSTDPADRIAPPGLLVRPGNDPISYFFAIRMERELEHIIGRFESALILADAADQPNEVQLPDPNAPVAAAEKSSEADVSRTVLHPALVEARQLRQDWPALIENQAYGEARTRWLEVRQSLWNNFPLDRPYAPAEIRAMWLDRGSIVRAGSRDRLATLFDNMQQSGINTVFFETVNAGFPIYRTQVAPQQNPLTEGWDPLADAVELAHERGIELHAWMWVFAAGNQRHNAILNKSDSFLGPSLSGNPDWVGYDQDGSPIPLGQTKPFYDPANPEARAFLLQLVDEIITTYDVDGLQLDYIRYPFQDPSAERTYGYGTAARRQFRRQTGVDPTELTPLVDPWLPRTVRERQRSLWAAWQAFKIEQVTSFVAETSELVRSKRPDIVLSTAVFAMPEHERLQKIQQDWTDWAEQGLVDWIVLMSYAQDANRFSEMIAPWVLEKDYGSTLVIPGIRLLGMPVPVVVDQLQALRDMPATGYALFATDNLDGRIQNLLHNTQGTHASDGLGIGPYAIAAERFRSLQREWNWLLANGQMTLQPRLADRWIEDVNTAGANLAALVEEPTVDVATVQDQVESLKRSMKVGLSLETATASDYRIQAWEYRLESISRFLTYGATRQRRG
ncbi:family 10 glycosylhydrolase [Oscillatoria sp. CS-180]|uniref:glycoside hydrolase family 10 protein n=1 Tax=Oscillatoria sp. CS-180 TaxID=3021720 RepID=UPI00232C7D64|nr:family 10 glycosylhydrolase [Oscillatoria sp. CS-180]MDB9529491.1 family 10 glycosylhydrolase [Oscillatoria sp. CS-180]